MKKVFSFVKGKKEEKKDSKQGVNPPISVEITNPSGQKITSDDEHIIGLQQGSGYTIDVSGKDKNLSKLHKASWFGQLDKVKLHAKKLDINSVDWMNRTCLHLAVSRGHTEVAWYLINNNASLTVCDSDGLTPFLKAVECGQKDCTNLLIECGVDIKSTDKDCNSGLHIAAKSGFYNIAALLLKEGVNINSPNSTGEFPIHLATSSDHREMVELLIRHGTSLEAPDRENRTPLMLAARNGLGSIIKVLLDSGASLEAVDTNGWTAEDYAQFGGHQDLVDILKVQKKEESVLDSSDKLSVQSSDPSENINSFEGLPSGPRTEDPLDSPRSCVIPPALEPPRSWDLIQSGVIDQDGAEVRRRSLITLGALKRESTGASCEIPLVTSDFIPVVLTPTSDKIPMEMRLSPDPSAREKVPTPERRTRSPLERANSLDLPSDQDSPGLGTPEETPKIANINYLVEHQKPTEKSINREGEEVLVHNGESNNNIRTMEKWDNLNKKTDQKGISVNDNVWIEVGKRSNDEEKLGEDRTYTMDYLQSYDNLDEKSMCTDNAMTGVSSSLDNLEDLEEKTMSIEIIQSTGKLDDTLSICTFAAAKNKFRESHSLELLEEQTEDMRSLRNKRHSRNKSITLQGQPQLWRSVDLLHSHTFPTFEKCKNIDAQLECYDEALRQLAKVNIVKIPQPQTQHELKDVGISCDELPHVTTPKNSIDLDNFCQNVEPLSLNFPPEVLENEPDSLDLEKDGGFPPPPTYFMENEDNEIVHITSVEGCLQPGDLNLPLPISILTPIKENNFESDSLSNMEGNESESSLKVTPSHFNVEVIVNNTNADESPTMNKSPSAVRLQEHDAPDGTEMNKYFDDTDDVFLQDDASPESYEKYFVDVRALQIHPDKIDFTKLIMPADSPSPTKTTRKHSPPQEVNNSPVDNSHKAKKLPLLNFDIGGVCTISNDSRSGSAFIRIEPGSGSAASGSKSDDAVASGRSGSIGRPIKRKRRQLLAMRGEAGDQEGGGAPGPEEQGCTTEDEEESSDEDPPFWHSSTRGGYFLRQNTVVPLTPTGTLNEGSFVGRSNINLSASIGNTPGSSETETASASDTPKFIRSPKGLEGSFVKEPALEKISQIRSTDGLHYGLEEARAAEAAREDTIAALHTQLARLEVRYAQAQEELCALRQRAVMAEQELEHMREICSQLSKEKEGGVPGELSQYLHRLERTKSAVELMAEKELHNCTSLGQVHLMIKHLEEEKKLEEDKNHRLVEHLEEVLMTNQNMIGEREALIAQNIADVRKLQEDTICWKERYEECLAKLELMDKRQDPRLIEAEDTIATLKRTIAILQQEKTPALSHHKPCDVSTNTGSTPRKLANGCELIDVPLEKERSLYSDITLSILQRELSVCQNLIETPPSLQINKITEIDKVSDLQQRLRTEVSRREALEFQMRKMLNELQQRLELGHQLDSMHRRFEKDFVSKKEIEEIKNQQDLAMEKMKQEAIVESETKISAKLSEINCLIQKQMEEQTRLERMRTHSESSIKQDFENISNTLQTELGKIQIALKEKEEEEKMLMNKCEQMEKDVKKNVEKHNKLTESCVTESGSWESNGGATFLFMRPTSSKLNGDLKLFSPKDNPFKDRQYSESKVEDNGGLREPSLEEKLNEELREKYNIKKK